MLSTLLSLLSARQMLASALGGISEFLAGLLKTRAGWALIGLAIGAGWTYLHVHQQWDADIAARTATIKAAQAAEQSRQDTVAELVRETSRAKAMSVQAEDDATDQIVKEITDHAPKAAAPDCSATCRLPADRVRRTLSIR